MSQKKTITFDSWMNPDQKGTSIAYKWTEWQNLKSIAMEKWKEIEGYIYATDTRTLEGGQNFDHTTHIPILHEVREDLISIMYSTILPHEDFMGWQPFDKEASTRDKRDKATAYLKNRHALNNFRKTINKCVRDYIDYGNAFCQVVPVNLTRTLSNGDVVPGYIGPMPKRISPYDIVFDPTADSFENTPKIVRTLLTVGQFKKMAEGSEDWDQEKVQEIIQKRGTVGSVDVSTNKKNNQYLIDGFGTIEQYYRSGMVELLWFYGDVFDDKEGDVYPDQCVVVADRATTVLQMEEPDPKIYHVGWKEKADNLWSQGALDQIVGLNYQVNHRENAKNDAIDKFIYPDRWYAGEVDEIYDPETGQTKFLGPEGGRVQDLAPDTTILSYDTQIDKLLQAARSASRLPPNLAGFRTPGEKTAFEVQSLQDGAFRGFIHKAEIFEIDLLEKVLNAELSIGRDTLSQAIDVQSVDSQGIPTFVQITEEDLKSNGKLVPYGSRRFARLNQQMAMLHELANSNLGGLIGQHLKTAELAKAVEYIGGFTDMGIIDRFANIEEQAEMAQLQNEMERMLVDEASQPSLQEQLMTPEDELE